MDATGYHKRTARLYVPRVLCEVLVANRSPRLEDLTREALLKVEQCRSNKTIRWCLLILSRVLASQGVLDRPMERSRKVGQHADPLLLSRIPPEWARLARWWFDTSTLSFSVRRRTYYFLLAVGRWLASQHPEVKSPAHWDRNLASQCVAMIDRLRCGEWTTALGRSHVPFFGRPVKANTKLLDIMAVRTFFRDLQEWGLIPLRFNPSQNLRPPRAIIALTGPNPRVIADDVWAKLLWAGLNLTADDVPVVGDPRRQTHRHAFYPIEMIRGLAVVWLFAGLRSNEVLRLRVGCVRWQRASATPDNAKDLTSDALCFLDVPVNKSGTAFTKPVDGLVGHAIEAWEKVRPGQGKTLDTKAGEMVDFLFFYRMARVGDGYLNTYLIPLLCHKAGVPPTDVGGKITSHRGRSTIASQLFNARSPMTLYELQEWMGHSSVVTTQYYAKITPTRLLKSYSDAAYFQRNLRSIEVLIDREKVQGGAAAKEPWRFYDLGHGYCTYDFFDQCPHRMACAKCAFYLPKQSAKAQILEGKASLLRLRQEIPLVDAELAAVEDGLAAYGKLLEKLADVPTPAGPPPDNLPVVRSSNWDRPIRCLPKEIPSPAETECESAGLAS